MIHKCLIITDDESLAREDVAAFWEQGISMDDYDYMILMERPDDVLEAREEEGEGDGQTRTTKRVRYFPKDWIIERLLQGCCDNRWHRANFQGKEYAVGVAYHA